MNDDPNIIKQRRVVIVLQIAVLVFILGGLFSAYVMGKQQTAAVPGTVNLDEAPLKQSNADVPSAMENVNVRAKAAFVYDVKGKRVLYSKNAETPLPLASITKLMTALLAHELVDMNADATVSTRALMEEGSNNLVPGEQMTMEELNKLALVSSSNDAAFALGANVGALLGNSDPTAQFVSGMNIRAEELELNSFNFKNTTGLDLSPSEAGAVGSARDVSGLMAHILNTNPDMLLPTTKASGRAYSNDGSYHDLENTNEVIYAIPNLLGSKTGYTDLAGGNLTIAFDAGLNRPIIVTVLGSTREERFSDVVRLVKAVQANISEL